jgi:hypothetical protein
MWNEPTARGVGHVRDTVTTVATEASRCTIPWAGSVVGKGRQKLLALSVVAAVALKTAVGVREMVQTAVMARSFSAGCTRGLRDAGFIEPAGRGNRLWFPLFVSARIVAVTLMASYVAGDMLTCVSTVTGMFPDVTNVKVRGIVCVVAVTGML